MNIPILDELLSELGRITDNDIRLAIHRSEPMEAKEERLSTLSMDQLKLEGLRFKLTGKAVQNAVNAQFQEADKVGFDALLAESSRLKHIGEIIKTILWGMIQDDIGWTRDEERTLGIRRDGAALVVVKMAPESSFAAMIEKLRDR